MHTHPPWRGAINTRCYNEKILTYRTPEHNSNKQQYYRTWNKQNVLLFKTLFLSKYNYGISYNKYVNANKKIILVIFNTLEYCMVQFDMYY